MPKDDKPTNPLAVLINPYVMEEYTVLKIINEDLWEVSTRNPLLGNDYVSKIHPKEILQRSMVVHATTDWIKRYAQ